MTTSTRWLCTWSAIALVAAGCARRDGNNPSEVKRGALDPETEALITGTVGWNGQPATGLASQTLLVFIEGEQHLAIDPTNGRFASFPLPLPFQIPRTGLAFVDVLGSCSSPVTLFAQLRVPLVAGEVSTVALDITSTAGKVIGTVTSNGVPVAHPLITLEGTCQPLAGDASGNFEGFLPPGTYTAHAGTALAPMSLATFTFDVVAGQTTDLRGGEPTPAAPGQNGLKTNGLWSSGLWSNGLWSNDLWSNGLWSNGLWSNGLWSNGLWSNGLWSNGLWSNGLWSNGLWSNGLTGTDAMPGNVLRSSGYARQLLQYIYSCAMPATTYDTTLDPNEGAPLVCAADTDCDVGYSCLNNNCVIPLQGAGTNGSGLSVNADGRTWWGDGVCDETCQRWVSACVIARTNTYGAHVQISMRAPADAPQAIKDALAVDAAERADFPLREGAFYGNIFATTPIEPPPSASYSGPATGAITSTPAFYACAGPGSNLAEITKRFSSIRGDQAVISVPGVCLTNASQPGVCAGEDTDPSSATQGAISGCRTSASPPGTQYQEVITVFLRQPIAVCGNGVCDVGEDSCPSDCHPGTWVRNYDPTFETLQTEIPPLGETFRNFADYSMAAVAPDDTIVVVGDTTAPIDLDGVLLPMSSGGAGVLVKYNADGSYAWPGRGVRFNNTLTTQLLDVTGITVAPSGNITVVGTTGTILWFSTFTAAGTQLATRTFALGASAAVWPGRNISVDSLDNTYVAGFLDGVATFPTTPPTTLVGGPGLHAFLMKASPTGAALFAQLIPGNHFASSLTNDNRDNTILSTYNTNATAGPTLIKKCADPMLTSCADGSTAWSKAFGSLGAFTAVAADAAGNVYAGGYFVTNTNFGGGPRAQTGLPPSLVKYDRNGVYQWDKQATVICAPAGCNFGSFVIPTNIGFDPAGNVVMASWGTPSIGGGIDFGFGTFPTYSTTNIFLSAYQPQAGALKWAKQIPGMMGINARGIGLDGQGRVVVSGTYAVSMLVDDVMLVTGRPDDSSTVNPFIASFGGPPAGDVLAPIIGSTVDQDGNPVNTVPQNIYVPATSAAGANVFFMPPTAIDTGNAGTSVVCWPPPNTTFPIGTTTVTCTASDPLGNDATASFTVTVTDMIGPIFSSPVADITVQAANASGAAVTYLAPTAIDQVSGALPVTCTPSSGSVFDVGHHTVTCTATDASNNQSRVTFGVDVTSDFGRPCVSSSECPAGMCVDGVCCNTPAASCGQCHACNTVGAVGTCAPTTGGTCNDSNACTQNDTCQAGTCAGATPVICAASDQCHLAGTCNPATGCSNPVAPNGTTCSDGNACTQTDTCQAGTCAGTNPVTCTASDQCHLAGTCNPATGACSNPAAPNGTTCSDANACTQTDSCQAGTCAGTNPVTCTASDQCHLAGTCNPATGACSNPAAPNGTTCSDANACTQTDSCQAGTCAGTAVSSCASTPLPPAADAPPLLFGGSSFADEGTLVLDFGNVGGNGGTVTVVESSSGPAPGDEFGLVPSSPAIYWDIDTTASFTPPVIICIHYAQRWVGDECVPPANMEAECGLQLAHFDHTGSGFTPLMAPPPGSGLQPLDTPTNMICGQTDTLSPFALVVRRGPVFDPLPGDVHAFATSTRGAKVSYPLPSAVDPFDGGTPVSCTPASGSQFPVGATTVTCSSSDMLGNTGVATFTVRVTYQAPTDGTFFLTPVRSDGSSVFRVGRAVPVKFRLTGASAGITDLVAKLIVTRTSDRVRGTIECDGDEDGEDTDMVFKYRKLRGIYGYRWKTRDQPQGTYRLRADLGDGVEHVVDVSLKKAK